MNIITIVYHLTYCYFKTKTQPESDTYESNPSPGLHKDAHYNDSTLFYFHACFQLLEDLVFFRRREETRQSSLLVADTGQCARCRDLNVPISISASSILNDR